MNRKCAVMILMVFWAHSFAEGRNVYVNPQIGSDSAEGFSPDTTDRTGPVKTIARGIALAQPGDTVCLGGFTYKDREEYVFVTGSKCGLPDKPITIDGQGALIDGATALEPNDWQQIEPGLYKNLAIFHTVLHGYEDWAARFSFVVNGKLLRMGHSLKAPSVPYLKPEKLRNGQWTYDKNDQAFYIKLDPVVKISDSGYEMPVVVSAVQVSGNISYIVFRNITARHVINDGFALTVGNDKTSKIRDIVYENITAIECCDDGFSSHGDCDVRVDGFVADGCGTGICSQGNSVNHHVVTRNIHAADIYFGSGRHIVADSQLHCQGRLGAVIAMVWPNEYGYQECSLTMTNTVIKSDPAGSNQIRIDGNGASLDARNLATSGLSFWATKGSTLKLHDSRIAGGAKAAIDLAPEVTWLADHNVYDIAYIQRADKKYLSHELADYQQATGQDKSSRWASPDSLTIDKPHSLQYPDSAP